MPKIKQLSSHEAQKIAAGEVVERPANIVKELIENSVDAGATRISVYIEDAGKQLIRVVDNGSGMDEQDAVICFDRHATSKITHVEQLELINTFGFRGEALASIAAVSQITLITKQENTHEGTRVIINAQVVQEKSTVACITGTDISINNLFFNVPARKKFLKTTQTEWRAIVLLFNAFCFDYPHIHFTLFSDGKQVHNCPAATNIKNRSLQMWESHISQHSIELHKVEKDGFSIEGIISDHQEYRYDRSGIYLFVNKRWVSNQHLVSALIKGYAHVIPEGRYPIAVISVTIPADCIDINIHPRKQEIKFLHPRVVEQALQNAIKTTLEKNLSQQIKKEVTLQPFMAERVSFVEQQRDFKPYNFNNFFVPQPEPVLTQFSSNLDQIPFPVRPEPVEGCEQPVVSFDKLRTSGLEVNAENINSDTHTQMPLINDQHDSVSVENYRLIGQYKKTYLLIEKEEGLFLVDQHAAHERILYELFSARFNEVATIQLLFPHVVTLSPQDMQLILPHCDIFSTNGIVVEQCASDQLIVQAVPVHLKEQSLSDLIKLVIGWISEYQSLDQAEFKKRINEKLHAQMACKAAVKAGDVLTEEKMVQLLHDLEKTANRFSCPHGRPTGWLLTINEIEKKFKRVL